MVQKKTTLATSTVGHLHKLIPSLKEKTTNTEFFVAHLFGFVHPNVSTTPETTNAASPHHLPVINIQNLQWFPVGTIPNPTTKNGYTICAIN